MNIAVNSIDNIQYSNQPDKEDQSPAQHFDLSKTFLQLSVALKIGEPMTSRIFVAPAIQPCLKLPGIGVLSQCRIYFRILRMPGQIIISSIAHDNLHTVYEAAVIDCDRLIGNANHLKIYTVYR